MNKNLFLSAIIIFVTSMVAAVVFGYQGIGPSFEIASHPEPDITNISVSPGAESVVVTATITDTSGISLAGLIIKDDGGEAGRVNMYDDGNYPDNISGDSIFAGLIDSSDYSTGFYDIDIYAKDVFANQKYIEKIGVINKGIACPIDNDAMVCIEILEQQQQDQNCIVSNGGIICATIPSAQIPNLNNCVTNNGTIICATIPSAQIPNLNNCVTSNGTIICAIIPSSQIPNFNNCVASNDSVLCSTMLSPIIGTAPICSTQGTKTVCVGITENPSPPSGVTIPTYVSVAVASAQDQGASFCLPVSTTMSIMQGLTVLSTKTLTTQTCVDDTMVSNLVNLTGNTSYGVKLLTPDCSGYADANGNCWYGGNLGQSCYDVCLDKGGNKTADCSEIDLNCNAIENLFGINCSWCDTYGPAGVFHYYEFNEDLCQNNEYYQWNDCYYQAYYEGFFAFKPVCVCNGGGGGPVDFNFPFVAGS